MVIREKSLSRIILFFLLCMIASPLVSCSREKNIYRQITDPKEIEARAIKNIDKYLWMFNWTKNENGHLLPEESIRGIIVTPNSYKVTDYSSSDAVWFAIPVDDSVERISPALRAFGNIQFCIRGSTLKDCNFGKGAEGFVLLENEQGFILINICISNNSPIDL